MSKSESRIKKKAYPIRLSDEDHAIIAGKAESAGRSFGGYVRDCALEKPIPIRHDRKQHLATQQLIAELRRLGGLQKHLFSEAGGYAGAIDPSAFAAVLAEIRMAIRRIEKGGEA